ncbi:MAG: hypothetical protein KKB30_00680 [Proteobacteria bacterium]|nr:hypothetical protein [Pseudomonadota bacterium]MBU1715327.1 hypothetical protein [Pseudomonadota bacterium]
MPKALPPKVLFIYYSFSGQTNGLLNHLAIGLRQEGVEVVMEKLRPLKPLRFPVGNIPQTLIMMLTTFFRARTPLQPRSKLINKKYNLIILAGPTWSYNPSGPILSLMDQDGEALFRDQKILPVISCRGYWRMHWYGLRKKLFKCGGQVPNHIVFSHPSKEPWRTIGVFLKIAGKAPERLRIFGKFYQRYGHSKIQLEEAEKFGALIGQTLKENKDLAAINFHTDIALP